jgi:hypothetical protein
MRKLLLAAVCLAGLSACGGRGVKIDQESESDNKPLRVVTQLQCPDHQGDLTRVRTAPDGLSCDYAGPRGSQVTLSLIKLTGGQDPEAPLKTLETQLSSLMPGTLARLAQKDSDAAKGPQTVAETAASTAQDAADKAEAEADAAQEKAEAAADKAEEAADKAADRAEDAVDRDDHRSSGDAEVTAPGVSVKSKNGSANVRLPGIKIDASKGSAHINVFGMHIDADDHKGGRGASHVEIHSDDNEVNVRAQDHAAEIHERKKGQGLRATYMLADDAAPATGWRMVGYEARGPVSGPIVVAVVKSKDGRGDSVLHAAKLLVKRNVGG